MEHGLKELRTILRALREQIEELEAIVALPPARQRAIRDRITAAKFQEQTLLAQLAGFEHSQRTSKPLVSTSIATKPCE
jgi:hypothetical protein